MDLKNNKLVNKYFSDLVERTSAPPMEIIADGTQANENPAASYRGFGCVTGNNSSRLLLDYKVEHPMPMRKSCACCLRKLWCGTYSH